MISLSLPYKNHANKNIWSYYTQLCSQINNINLADSLSENEAELDNNIYILIDVERNKFCILVGLSQINNNNNSFEPYTNVWVELDGLVLNNKDNYKGILISSLDIKKYNSALAFNEDYKDRDNINLLFEDNKFFYKISNNNYIDLSPVIIRDKTKQYILASYSSFLNIKNKDNIVTDFIVSPVDKNSFLLPFMAYKDFLNFATFNLNNKSMLTLQDNYICFLNELKEDNIKFYSKTILREDKFSFSKSYLSVSPGLWQTLVMLQNFKIWDKLCYTDNCAFLYFGNNIVYHIFHDTKSNVIIEEPNLEDFKLVGKISSNDLFKLNKLYSNANRTCYFDFSTQTFTGNNYAFSDNKLEVITIDLEDKVEAELPLKITLTEIKHYIGSDLSQKNFTLYIYTDGIRVMLERYNDISNSLMECRVIFDHSMSKKNQRLTVI